MRFLDIIPSIKRIVVGQVSSGSFALEDTSVGVGTALRRVSLRPRVQMRRMVELNGFI